MSLSNLQRDGFQHEHRADAARQRRADQENLEALRISHEREDQLRKGDLRRKETELREREDALIERESQLAGRERDANTEAAEDMARDLHTDVVDRAFDTGNSAAIAAAIIRAGDRARSGVPPPEPTNPTARAMIAAHKKALGLTDVEHDKPPPGSMAAKILVAAAKARL